MKLHSSASYSYLISLVFLKTGFPSFSSPISKRSEYSSLFLWSTWKSAHLSAFTRFFAYIYRQKIKLELTVMSWIISSHLPDKNRHPCMTKVLRSYPVWKSAWRSNLLGYNSKVKSWIQYFHSIFECSLQEMQEYLQRLEGFLK